MAMNDLMIRIFLSAAETNSFTKTAKTMFLSQQAVSQNVSRLEEHLGFPLFERSTRSVQLTAAGQELYAFFRDASGQFLSLVSHLQNRASDASALLRIGIMDRLSIDDFITATELRLRELHPEIRLEWAYEPGHHLSDLLHRGDLDLYISFAGPADSEGIPVGNMHILDSQQVLLIAADYPDLTPNTTAQDLQALPLLLFQNVNSSGTPEDEVANFRLYHTTPDYAPADIRVLASEANAKLAVKLGKGVTLSNSRCEMATDPAFRSIPLPRSNAIHCFWDTRNPKQSLQYLLNAIS
jgi:DNA-binding transcriptional LysR family regulator